MPPKLLCVVCNRGHEENQFVNFMDKDGNKLLQQNICTDCRCGRDFSCPIHTDSHVVFIDSSSACAQCTIDLWMKLYPQNRTGSQQRKFWRDLYKFLAGFVPRTKRKYFLRVMRNGAQERKMQGGKALSLAAALFANRFHVDTEVAQRYFIRHIPKAKTFDIALPSAIKPYKPKSLAHALI